VTRRRDFLASGGSALCAIGLGARPVSAQDVAARGSTLTAEEGGLVPHPARWYKKLPDLWVECGLCPHGCKVPEGERGVCGVRENRRGVYFTLVHSRPCVVALDPVEKKPLFHFLPGKPALSLATPGCNFDCKCCQNWEIAQARPEQVPSSTQTPEDLVALAHRRGAPIIACTYSEPVVWSEYVLDIAAAGKRSDVRTVVISNGYIQQAPLADLCREIAAYKVDLKGFSEKFYKEHSGGELKPVLDTLRTLRRLGTWTEVVVLVIPTLNDQVAEIRSLARFVRDELGAEVPVHFTRFHPNYRLMNLPSTPVTTLERARQTALDEGLAFAYVGNVPGHPGENTFCPGCGKILIRRLGMSVAENRLVGGACPDCHRKIPGIWS
jgi:pyruvate formate lyase activating enzyme